MKRTDYVIDASELELKNASKSDSTYHPLLKSIPLRTEKATTLQFVKRKKNSLFH